MYQLLIADDELDERMLVKYLLKEYEDDINITEASNGKMAVSLLQKQHFDILISDIEMPFINGIDLATKAKELYPDIEIMFFSGFDDFNYVRNALSLHAVNYILKPINQTEFHESLSEILKRLDSKTIEFTKSEKYIEDHFHDTTDFCPEDSAADTTPTLEDSNLLGEIKTAIRESDTEALRNTVMHFIDKYSKLGNVSHMYIRYMCTSVLQALLSCQSDGKDRFDSVVRQVYYYKHFSDISSLIEEYLDAACESLEKELPNQSYAVTQTIKFIEQHYNDDISLTTLADLVFLSPNYLSNIFAKETGSTINKYIRSVRLKKAATLVKNTNMKISDIAAKVGFSNTSYFCKKFQEAYAATPDAYRQVNSSYENTQE